MRDVTPILRFAPSPNGLLHLGHAFSALTNMMVAAQLKGQLHLRLEDIDPARCRSHFEAAIVQDLAWLGITFAPGVRRQSEHLDLAHQALAHLQARGLVYPCFCTRAEIARTRSATAATDPDGSPLYLGTCRGFNSTELFARRAQGLAQGLAQDLAPVWRLNMAAALAQLDAPLTWQAFDPAQPDRTDTVPADPARWGDVVLARRDTPTSYHLSVVLDDAAQGVTHVVRGADLLAATDVHAVLQALLALPRPCYHHHRLILDDTGEKLSKRSHAQSLQALRDTGVTPADIRRTLGFDPTP